MDPRIAGSSRCCISMIIVEMCSEVIDRRVSARNHPTPSKAQNRMDRSWGRGGNDKGRGVKTADNGSLIASELAGTGVYWGSS